MDISFSEENWRKIQSASDMWWAGKLGRPLIQARLSGYESQLKKPVLPSHAFTSFYDMCVKPEQIVECWNYSLSTMRFFGDAFPVVWPNFGPGVLSAFMGSELENGDNTVWFHAHVQPLSEIKLAIRRDNIWFRRISDIIKAADSIWGGQVLIASTDLGGNLDSIAPFRTTEQLLIDLIENAAEVKRLVMEAHQVWWQAYDYFSSLTTHKKGFSSWTPLFSPTPGYMLQCDFSYMISPQMFKEFVKPELALSASRLRPYAFYHLDGAGQLAHLDEILQIDDIRGIQWVPGDGQPDISKWPGVYRRITEAGKLIQFFSHQYQGPCDEIIDIIANQTGCAENIACMIDVDRSKEKQILCKRRSKSAAGGGLIVRHRGYTYPLQSLQSNIF